MAAVAAGGRRLRRRGAAARRVLGAGEPPAFLVGRPPSSGRAGPWRGGLRRRFGRSGSGAACSNPASPVPAKARGRRAPVGGGGVAVPLIPPVAPIRSWASPRGWTGGVSHAPIAAGQPGAKVRAQTVPPAKKSLACAQYPLGPLHRGANSVLRLWEPF